MLLFFKLRKQVLENRCKLDWCSMPNLTGLLILYLCFSWQRCHHYHCHRCHCGHHHRHRHCHHRHQTKHLSPSNHKAAMSSTIRSGNVTKWPITTIAIINNSISISTSIIISHSNSSIFVTIILLLNIITRQNMCRQVVIITRQNMCVSDCNQGMSSRLISAPQLEATDIFGFLVYINIFLDSRLNHLYWCSALIDLLRAILIRNH